MTRETIRSHPVWSTIGIVLFLTLAYTISSFIGSFVFGIFLYYISRPVYRRIKKYVHYNAIAAALSLTVVALPLIATLVSLGITGIREYRLAEQQLDIVAQLNPYIDALIGETTLENLSTLPIPTTLDTARNALEISIQYASVVGIAITHLFIVILLAFYLLRDDTRLAKWALQFDNKDHYLERYMRAVDTDFHAIFFGNILNAFIAGTIASFLYIILNAIAPGTLFIPYPVLLGALVGFASLIPIVGMKIVYIPVTVYLFYESYQAATPPEFWFPTAFIVTTFVLADTIPDVVLRPYVSGKNTHIGMLMAAYIFGPLLFGWYGLFLAPILLILGTQFARIIMPELLENRTSQHTQTTLATLPGIHRMNSSEPEEDTDSDLNTASN